MRKFNIKNKILIVLITFLIFAPLISGLTFQRKTLQISVNFPKQMIISQAEIFDGMIVNYTFQWSGNIYSSGFTYEFNSGHNFDVTWQIKGSGISTWVENELNREISMSAGGFSFDDGAHAPIWIFTNVSLFDIVPIAVDGDGDHSFNITKEKIFNIPGFGSIEVWQLEDLDSPEGIAWYEKSTGILIKGYFDFGMGDYTLEFYDTNAVFNYVSPVSGLFDGLYMDYFMASEFSSVTQDISYTGDSINKYNLTSHLSIPASDDKWTEDTTTRIMSNVADTGMNFLPGNYTPYWIFTNVSVGVKLPIAVDGEGNHVFKVNRSVNSDFPGFGPLSAWELKDMDGLGGRIWYEKKSGILLNGTFVWGFGMGYYNYTLLNTNANFGYLLPFPFTLSTNATNPDIDGNFNLEWTNSEFAKNYSIYEHSSYITEYNNSLTPIVLGTINMTKHLSGYNTGDYYFLAVAKNDFGLTLSNSIKITVAIPSPGIPGYEVFLVLLAGLSVSIIMIKKWKTVRISK